MFSSSRNGLMFWEMFRPFPGSQGGDANARIFSECGATLLLFPSRSLIFSVPRVAGLRLVLPTALPVAQGLHGAAAGAPRRVVGLGQSRRGHEARQPPPVTRCWLVPACLELASPSLIGRGKTTLPRDQA